MLAVPETTHRAIRLTVVQLHDLVIRGGQPAVTTGTPPLLLRGRGQAEVALCLLILFARIGSW